MSPSLMSLSKRLCLNGIQLSLFITRFDCFYMILDLITDLYSFIYLFPLWLPGCFALGARVENGGLIYASSGAEWCWAGARLIMGVILRFKCGVNERLRLFNV